MTIQENFEEEQISKEFLREVVEHHDSPYWENCLKFVEENWTVDTVDLSTKQVNWMIKILDDIVEYRIENRGQR